MPEKGDWLKLVDTKKEENVEIILEKWLQQSLSLNKTLRINLPTIFQYFKMHMGACRTAS